jgi:hypothetical protein
MTKWVTCSTTVHESAQDKARELHTDTERRGQQRFMSNRLAPAMVKILRAAVNTENAEELEWFFEPGEEEDTAPSNPDADEQTAFAGSSNSAARESTIGDDDPSQPPLPPCKFVACSEARRSRPAA